MSPAWWRRLSTPGRRGRAIAPPTGSEVGQTTGRGRQDRRHQHRQSVKQVWVYALHPQARQRLGGRAPAPPPPPADWAEEEFGGARLGDARLGQRLLTLARDRYARPQAHPAAGLSDARQNQSRLSFLGASGHHRWTLCCNRILKRPASAWLAEKLVLAVQDTTSLNYTTHRATDDLGPIGTQAEGALGLWLHSTLAFNAEGTPLGLLDVQCWARDGRQFGKHHERKKRSIEEKESAKWLKSFRALAEVQRRTPGTRLVSVGDREADIYELFQEALGRSRKVRGCWCAPSKTACWPRGRNTCGRGWSSKRRRGCRKSACPGGARNGRGWRVWKCALPKSLCGPRAASRSCRR